MNQGSIKKYLFCFSLLSQWSMVKKVLILAVEQPACLLKSFKYRPGQQGN